MYQNRMFSFTLDEIGLMEIQVLFLLDWELGIDEYDVYQRAMASLFSITIN